ncbi:MAG TPA: hypothetical protein VHO70_24090, partial [Chitinispirillaceae bacterium]|nr:hypothetical protein [Chitinispirillaceae bacterium]
NDKRIEEKLSPKSWECTKTGFWKDKPYLCLSDCFYYEIEKVILFQHTVLSDNEKPEIYRFWTHLFSHDKIESILEKHGLKVLSFNEDILPEGGLWGGDNITFTVAQKP